MLEFLQKMPVGRRIWLVVLLPLTAAGLSASLSFLIFSTEVEPTPREIDLLVFLEEIIEEGIEISTADLDSRLADLETRLNAIEGASPPTVAAQRLSDLEREVTSLEAGLADIQTTLRLERTDVLEVARLRDEVNNLTGDLTRVEGDLKEDLAEFSTSVTSSDQSANDRISSVDSRITTISVGVFVAIITVAIGLSGGILYLGRQSSQDQR